MQPHPCRQSPQGYHQHIRMGRNPAEKRDRVPPISSKSASSYCSFLSNTSSDHKDVAILEPDQVWSVVGRDERTSELAEAEADLRRLEPQAPVVHLEDGSAAAGTCGHETEELRLLGQSLEDLQHVPQLEHELEGLLAHETQLAQVRSARRLALAIGTQPGAGAKDSSNCELVDRNTAGAGEMYSSTGAGA